MYSLISIHTYLSVHEQVCADSPSIVNPETLSSYLPRRVKATKKPQEPPVALAACFVTPAELVCKSSLAKLVRAPKKVLRALSEI